MLFPPEKISGNTPLPKAPTAKITTLQTAGFTLAVMFVSHYDFRLPQRQRGAVAVWSDRFLGPPGARHKIDRIKLLPDMAVPGGMKDTAVIIGKDDDMFRVFEFLQQFFNDRNPCLSKLLPVQPIIDLFQ